MRTAACLVLLAACGGSSSAPTHPAAAASSSPTASTPVATATSAPPTTEQVCNRVEELMHQQCGAFGKTLNVTPIQCNQMFGEAIADPNEAKFRARTEHCIMKPECQQVSDCLADLSKPDPEDLRECGAKGASSVGVTAAEYAQRNGSGAKLFKNAASTKAAPVERCGIENANAWLASLTCGDGSRPISDGPSAEPFRVGNVGKAGRCNSIIDHYKVACPDGSTDIYIDAYVCPK